MLIKVPFITFCLVGLTLVSARGRAQSFTITASPAAITIHPGDQKVPINVSVGTGGYTGPVGITLQNLPSGISVTPAPLVLNTGSTGTLFLSAATNADQESFAANSPANPNTATSTIGVVAAAGSVRATSTLALTVSLSNPSFAPASGQVDLPVLNINTNGVPILDGDTDVPGTLTITSADGSTVYFPNASDSDNTAKFHLHGNTTSVMPKKPYHIKLNTSLDLLGAMGMTCPYVTGSNKPVCDKSKSYDLLANYDDKTLLRDWAASALANAIPMGGDYLSSPPGSPSPSGTSTLMPWAPHSLFVELYVNGAYEGNYQLIEQIKIDSHRVNISELDEDDTGASGDDITGGYLMEIDQHKDEAYVFTTPKGVPIGLDDPDFSPDPEVPAQTAYISQYVDTAEDALFGADFTDPKLGWRAYFDEAAAINFYIVNDVMGNVDGGDFYSSVYLYKDKDNPLLYMGPIWDFDISSGNVNYFPIVNPTVPWMQTQAIWYKQWLTDPGFKADLVKQWNALKNNGVFANWIASIQAQAALLQQSQANNFARWPMLGIKVWPNAQAAASYNGEVNYLTSWLNLRISYLDSILNNKAQTTTTLGVPGGTVRSGTPANFDVTVAGSTTPTGTVSLLAGGVIIATAPLDGSGKATLTTSKLPAGNASISAVYSGDSTNALSASSTVSIAVATPLAATVTSLASSATATTAGDSVTFTASVLNNSGSATPTGTLSFISNGVVLGSAMLMSGSASITTAALAAGTDVIEANYSGDANYNASSSNQVSVTVSGGGSGSTVAAPVVSPGTGSYASAQTVTLSDTTAGATIYYTLDGSTPTTQSTLYSGPITVTATATLKAIAVLSGVSSPVSTATYTINGATTPVNFGNGFNQGNLSFNGTAALNGARLRLTTAGATYVAGSSFYTSAVNVQAFINDFTFQLTNPSADGFMFVIQGQGTNALGGVGSYLGFSGTTAIRNSVGVKFDLFNNSSEGTNSTGLYLNGAEPILPASDLTASGVQLHSGDVFRVHMTYDGASLTVSITDIVTGATATQTYSVNIPAVVGGTTAFIGFTGATGGLTATQEIVSWTYSTAAPTASGSINYGNGFTAGNLSLNGTAALSGSRLRLTANGGTYASASSFYTSPVNVQAFTNDFLFQLTSPSADGIMFVIQGQGANALGAYGGDLGFGSGAKGIRNSVGVKFDLYSNAGEGTNSTGLYLNGAPPSMPATDLTPTGVQLHSGNIFRVHMKYDGSTLAVTITDTATNASATQTYSVNIPGVVGGNTAYVGFTGGTGGLTATQEIVTWNYTPTTPTAPSSIDYGNGFSPGQLFMNGTAAVDGTRLSLTTTSTMYAAASAFYASPVNVQAFTNDFTFQLANPTGDGMMFVIQRQGADALGAYGSDLGFGSGSHGIRNSVGVKFDLFNNAGEGANSTGLYINGAAPTTPATDLTQSGVQLHSGNPFRVHMTYDGTTLTVTITDTVTGATATQNYAVNIPATVGGSTAFVGFTAGTGVATANQEIMAWTYAMATPSLPTAINYADGFTAGDLFMNGAAALNGSRLSLTTTSSTYAAASSFYAAPVNVQTFTNDFAFQLTNPSGDGMMFVIQGQGANALGVYGSDLGFGSGNSGIRNSVGVKFDLFDNAGEGTNSTGLYINGAAPTVPATDLTSSGVLLHSGDIFHVHMKYDGTTLAVTITDTVTGATATQSYTVDIPAIVGGNTAYAGFTAGTGAATAKQEVITWTFGQ